MQTRHHGEQREAREALFVDHRGRLKRTRAVGASLKYTQPVLLKRSRRSRTSPVVRCVFSGCSSHHASLSRFSPELIRCVHRDTQRYRQRLIGLRCTLLSPQARPITHSKLQCSHEHTLRLCSHSHYTLITDDILFAAGFGLVTQFSVYNKTKCFLKTDDNHFFALRCPFKSSFGTAGNCLRI